MKFTSNHKLNEQTTLFCTEDVFKFTHFYFLKNRGEIVFVSLDCLVPIIFCVYFKYSR